MANLTELLAQRAELEKQIVETQREERDSALSQIRQLMAQYGLTVADLTGRAGANKALRGSGSAGATAGRSGTKVAAKYRDAQTGDTWSGRGLQPRWLKAAMAAGKKLGDFAL